VFSIRVQIKSVCFGKKIRIIVSVFQEVGLGYEDWIGLAQDRNRWRGLVSAVRNLRVP